MEKTKTSFGQFLWEMCAERGINQGELSKVSGFPQPHLSLIMSNKRYIGKSIYERLASALDFTYDERLSQNLKVRRGPKTKVGNDETFGGFIANLRVERGYLTEELEKASGLSLGTLNSIQREEQLPNQTQLQDLVSVLDFTVERPEDFINEGLKPISNSFGAFLKDLRRERRLTPKELAVSAGITPQRIHQLEHTTGLPSRKLLSTLMDILVFTPEDPTQVSQNRGRPRKESK